ncbi:vWA domain-containing protein [Phragmitibacter flavus]|nr:BatA and WFA domain-containing protein [Phragmitibacter flavus]
MSFLTPQWLHLLWLGLIPVALYLFRRKAKRVRVSTLLFFRSLAREHQESAWLRRLKRLLSLLLTLLVILMAVLALGRPYREAGGEVPRSLVVMLDRSASMAAVDGEGMSRLEVAKGLLRERLKALPDNVITSLVVYDGKVEVAQSRSTNRRELLRLVNEVRVVPVEDKVDGALAVAKRLGALDAPSQIWHVSDRAAEGAVGDEDSKYRFVDVALKQGEAVNVGITAFQIRPAPMARNRYEAFVEVAASGSNAGLVQVTLETRLDGRPVQLRELEMAPGSSSRLVLPLDGGRGQRLEMEAKAKGDVLAWDNLVMSPLPEVRPLVVAWLAKEPDPFTELALSSLLAEERIQVLKGGEKDWPLKDKPDLYVFENWVPETWPTDRPALVLNPPTASGPVLARRLDLAVPHEAVRAVQPEHPLLFRVVNARVAVTQTTVLNVAETLETLWMAGNEPVLVAGEANGQRLVITAFQPSKSEQLALLPAFPLLVGNAIYWCVEGSGDAMGLRAKHTGGMAEVKPGEVKWQWWDGNEFGETMVEAKSGWLALDRVGLFEDGGGVMGSSLLLSARESEVPVAVAKESVIVEDGEKERWAVGGSWWAVLLWGVLGMLLLESWLFHREAVY